MMVSKTQATNIIVDAVVEGVKKASKSPSNDLSAKDTRDVANDVLSQVVPTMDHITSSEKWWQSRTVVGQIIGMICLVGGPIVGVTVSPEDQAAVTGAIVAIGGAINLAFTLWARYVAKKPLFSKP